jgi:hypothetical protein
MKAELKEFTDKNGTVVIAVVWVIAIPFNVAQMNVARMKLNDFISNYVGTRGHNVYMHTEKDTVSAIITFDLNNYPGVSVQI